MSLIRELDARGLLADATRGAAGALQAGRVTGYVGFDPTAPSLHAGSLVPIMGLVRLQRAGHSPIALVGGGTGLIGDPSGKSSERILLDRVRAEENAHAIHAQLRTFLDFDASSNPARMANNAEWLEKLPLVDFLRDVGKHFSVNQMLRRESVRRRLEDAESGISFAEFSYQLLQSYDFLELNRRHGCTLQMGGSDQWGNIVAGIDLVRRAGGDPCHGVVFPLLTTSSGAKFGKTEAGAVWLDPSRTSPYAFYQYWLNAADEDAISFLRMFTLLPNEKIVEAQAEAAAAPHARIAQKLLARELTRTVHGEEGLGQAHRASEALFGGSLDGLGADEIGEIFRDVPSSAISREALRRGALLIDVLASGGACASKGAARRLIRQGGAYLNGARVADETRSILLEDAVEERFVVLRLGRKKFHLLEAK